MSHTVTNEKITSGDISEANTFAGLRCWNVSVTEYKYKPVTTSTTSCGASEMTKACSSRQRRNIGSECRTHHLRNGHRVREAVVIGTSSGAADVGCRRRAFESLRRETSMHREVLLLRGKSDDVGASVGRAPHRAITFSELSSSTNQRTVVGWRRCCLAFRLCLQLIQGKMRYVASRSGQIALCLHRDVNEV